jgi:site-specific DNA-methyltransferase (adenine-specific)
MSRFQLFHGDALEEMRLLGTNSVAAIVTDPPYAGSRLQISKTTRPDADWFVGDCMGSDSYLRWMRLIALEGIRVVESGGLAYVFIDWRQYVTMVTAWESAGWTLKNVVVWDKAKGGAMGTFWRNNHEWVCVFAKGRAKWRKGISQYNTWAGAKKRGGLHPTEKPVELLTFLQNGVASRGGVILDPFAGSCSTGVAALMGGFNFIGIERDARYIDYGRDNLLAVGDSPC